jgi:ABC-type oligopeptide transport system substrate-binding subunit
MQVRRIAALATLPVLIAGSLAACTSSDKSDGADDTVKIGLSEPEHLIPSSVVESNGNQIIKGLWTPLVRFDDHGKAVMAAAESIESTDKKVWTVKLKDGYTFHNGQKVTSDSYRKAWNYGAYSPNAAVGGTFFEKIAGYQDLQAGEGGGTPKATEMSGLKKVDDLTFQVTLSAPFPEWPKSVGFGVFSPMPDVAYGPDGKVTKEYSEAPIGQGPFKMKGKWEHNQGVTIERYDACPDIDPKVKTVEFKFFQDLKTEYSDLVAGNIDTLQQIDSSSLANAKNDLDGRVRTSASSYIAFLTVPSYDTTWQKPEVRKAVSMAINRKEIVDRIFAGGAYTPASSWVANVVEGAREDSCGEACKYDPVAAKALLAQAGGLPGNKIEIWYNADGGHKDWVEAICNQVKNNLGIECQGATVAQFADMRQKAREHTLKGLLRGAWSFDYPSIENYLNPMFGTGQSSNDSEYSNRAFDQLMTEAGAAPNQDEMIKKYQAAEDLVAKDLPTIPLWFRGNMYGFSERMKNVDMDVQAEINLLTLELK